VNCRYLSQRLPVEQRTSQCDGWLGRWAFEDGFVFDLLDLDLLGSVGKVEG
jgi:hypothetical protein